VRRVLRVPQRWDRIVELAAREGERLPAVPDAAALNAFLVRRRAADPAGFAHLSLSVMKLLGHGEYVASFPDEPPLAHFGLAVSDYTHSTAPNRRYPDLVTQRLALAALANAPAPMTRDALVTLAARCTQRADDARRIERLVRKAAAACLLSSRTGEVFDAVVTGAGPKGTWARLRHPPVEGRIQAGAQGLDVGDAVRLKLVHTDPERGWIDLERVS
jgi:exoribonuclease-2